MVSEKENAEVFRQIQSETVARKTRDEKLGMIDQSLAQLKSLLEAREALMRDLGSGYRAADEINRSSQQRKKDMAEKQQISGVQQMMRVKEIRDLERASSDELDGQAVGRLIQTEKARQLAETAVMSRRSNRAPISSVDAAVNSVFEKMELEPRKTFIRKKRESSKRSESLGAVSLKEDTVPVLKIPKQKKEKAPRIKPPHASYPVEDLSVVRKSIDSMRRSCEKRLKEAEFVLDFPPPSPVSGDIIARESRDAARVLERKRATLASLKLKSKPSR